MVVSLWWLASVREDLGLLADAYLPETLLVTVLLVLMWGIRKCFTRDARSIS